MATTASNLIPACSMASAWAMVQGTPSRMKPFCSRPSLQALIVMMLDDNLYPAPACLQVHSTLLALRPVGVPFFTACTQNVTRGRWWGTFSLTLRMSAWVPLPAPKAPKKDQFIKHLLFQEALILTASASGTPEPQRSPAPTPNYDDDGGTADGQGQHYWPALPMMRGRMATTLR